MIIIGNDDCRYYCCCYRGIYIFVGLVLATYIALSAITFILYAVDKSAARNNKHRIPERTLHLMSLLGGWPGALLAQQIFRHKTKKQPFRVVFWMTVIVNVSTILFFIAPSFPSRLEGIMMQLKLT
ncbi:MAG: DUF1294 domain-containing protein [Methylophaga sp.]|nr:DUF1294 domain-containing protein [Methylophaga sp.]